MDGINLRRVFLYLLIASVGLSALFGIGVILLGDFGSFEVRVLMTTLTITAASILGLACGACLEAGRGRILPILGIALSILSALLVMFVIWDVLDEAETFVKSVVTMAVVAVASSYLPLLSIARRPALRVGLAYGFRLRLAARRHTSLHIMVRAAKRKRSSLAHHRRSIDSHRRANGDHARVSQVKLRREGYGSDRCRDREIENENSGT